MALPNGKPMFPCPVCTQPREVSVTNKDKPYLVCAPCGIQVFVRGPAGIAEFNRLLQRVNRDGLLTRLAEMERRYRKTCPKCGKPFWITPEVLETSWFNGELTGYRCLEKGCRGVVKLESAE